MVNPVVVNFNVKNIPNGVRLTQLIVAAASIIAVLSMVALTVVSILANTTQFRDRHGLGSQGSTPLALDRLNSQKEQGGSSDMKSTPIVELSVNKQTALVGEKATITWSVSGDQSLCIASDDWSGGKDGKGGEEVIVFDKAQSYLFTLTCSTPSGTGFAAASIVVGDTPQVTTSPPVKPTEPTGTGNVATRPRVAFSVSSPSVMYGGSAMLSWNVANNPTSCTAGGSWSGSKAASGSQSTGGNSAGTYTYALTCSNNGGTSSKSVSLVVNPAPVYCGGKTPCYGKSDLAAHATVGNCWGWNGNWAINITSYNPVHKGGILAGSTSSLENNSATCNHDINAILRGVASIPGYKDKRANSTFTHRSDTINNTTLSALSGYRVGYYDSSKP